MAILQYYDSRISVQTQRNKNFCWAACIEMVTAKYNKDLIHPLFQCQLAEKQVELLKEDNIIVEFDFSACSNCDPLGDLALRKGSDLYERLFREICQMDCNQFTLETFPDWTYIQTQTAKGLPIIVSGIYIPSCPGASHAVVITGCFVEVNHLGQEIHWVLINDPYVANPCESERARKTAWIYEELVKIHHIIEARKRGDDELPKPLIFVSDFRVSDPSPIQPINEVKSFSSMGNTYAAFIDKQLKKQMKQLMESLFGDSDDLFLFDYFGFTQQKEINIKGVTGYKSIDGTNGMLDEIELMDKNSLSEQNINTGHKDLEIIQEGSNLSLLLIYQDGKPIIDIYIQYDNIEDQNRILGFREHNEKDRLDFARIPSNDVPFSFNHEHPNYTLLDIAPFGFRFMEFEHEGVAFYAPIFSYNCLKAESGMALPSFVIQKRLAKKLSSGGKGPLLFAY